MSDGNMATEVDFVPPSADSPVEAPVMKALLWRVIIEPQRPPEKIGKIQIPEKTVEDGQYRMQVGKVVEMGELCYKAHTQSGLKMSDDGNAPKVGDYVLYAQYAGTRIKTREGRQYIVLNDDEILATVDDPQKFEFHY